MIAPHFRFRPIILHSVCTPSKSIRTKPKISFRFKYIGIDGKSARAWNKRPQKYSPKHTPLTSKMTLESDKAKSLPSVGARIVDNNGFRATVRYVGPVCTAKDPTGKWIGEKQHVVASLVYYCSSLVSNVSGR